jgi:Tol biopolymer transport system component
VAAARASDGRSRFERAIAGAGRLATMVGGLAFLVLCLGAAASAATRYDPELRFRSITTPHFVIHFHAGEESLALRLSLIVEQVFDDLTERLQHVPRGRTHVVLVDQSDDPNGWSTPFPYNLIEIAAAPPGGASRIGNTSDWLRLVFTHEYTHVLHLEQSRGWASVARALFGRAPFAFPNLTLPRWQIEGIATFEESQGGEGRLHAGDFHAIVGRAAATGRFEPIDRVSGGLVDWPSGEGWYSYGAYFQKYLADRFGEQSLAALSHRTAGWLPYIGAGAYRRQFGQSLGELWRDFARTEAGRQATAVRQARATRVTRYGFLVEGPRFDRDGTILYTRQDPHGFPTLARVTLSDGATRTLSTRYGGVQVTGDDHAIYFDQLEIHANVALESDLYRLDRHTGSVRRLTRGARLADPDVSPDGRQIAAVHLSRGQRTLVVLDRERLDAGGRGIVLHEYAGVSGGEVTFANPRWSPDGRWIAAERRVRPGPSEVVLVNPLSGAIRVVASSASGRNVTPTWTPDGGAILFASDRNGDVFDVYRTRIGPDGDVADASERLTHEAGGAFYPDVSKDSRTLVFVGYTTDGYDLFTVPLRDPVSLPPPVTESAGALAAGDSVAASSHTSGKDVSTTGYRPQTGVATDNNIDSTVAPQYRPWSTLWPRAWLPVIETNDYEVRAGAAAAGFDALGYHNWAATVTWSVARDASVEPVSPGARPDLQLVYAYDRWWPTLFGQYTDETTPLLIREQGIERPVALRDRSIEVGAAVPFRRVRWSQAALVSWRREHDVVSGPVDSGSFDRGGFRFGWQLNTAKTYGYSISPEEGVTTGVSAELVRRAFGSDGDAEMFRADARCFLPLGPPHAILALRATAATSRGDASVSRVLRLGGHDGDDRALSFDEDASSLLRGFPSDAFLGRNVALANLEYRLPLAYVQRGLGTWPVFLRAAHISGLFDIGHAWTERFDPSDLKSSWGVEVGADATAGYVLPFTVVAGVAWGHDGAGTFPDNREVYVRFGRGF